MGDGKQKLSVNKQLVDVDYDSEASSSVFGSSHQDEPPFLGDNEVDVDVDKSPNP